MELSNQILSPSLIYAQSTLGIDCKNESHTEKVIFQSAVGTLSQNINDSCFIAMGVEEDCERFKSEILDFNKLLSSEESEEIQQPLGEEVASSSISLLARIYLEETLKGPRQIMKEACGDHHPSFIQAADSFMSDLLKNHTVAQKDFKDKTHEFIECHIDALTKKGHLVKKNSDGVVVPMTQSEIQELKNTLKTQLLICVVAAYEYKLRLHLHQEAQSPTQKEKPSSQNDLTNYIKKVYPKTLRSVEQLSDMMGLLVDLERLDVAELQKLEKFFEEQIVLQVIEYQAKVAKKLLTNDAKFRSIEHKELDREILKESLVQLSIRLNECRKNIIQKNELEQSQGHIQLVTLFDDFDHFLKIIIQKNSVEKII